MTIEIPDHLVSWHLDRLSPHSDINSVVLHLKNLLSEQEILSISHWLRGERCYRFRVGNRRYYFGSTPQEAIDAAVRAEGEPCPSED